MTAGAANNGGLGHEYAQIICGAARAAAQDDIHLVDRVWGW